MPRLRLVLLIAFVRLSQLGALPVLCMMLFGCLNLAAQDGCIQGKVVDTTGAPVPSTHVIASSMDYAANGEVVTHRDGYFMLGDLIAGRVYRVAASDKSEINSITSSKTIAASPLRITAAAGDRCPSVTLRLPQRARFYFKATNLLTGEPIQDLSAQFRLNNEELWRGGLNERGELLVPPNSEVEVRVGRVGYYTSDARMISSPKRGSLIEVSVALQPLQTGCITGMALDEKGTPVQGVRVYTSGYMDRSGLDTGDKFTDANGRFRFDDVQPGSHSVYMHAEDYPLSTRQKDPAFTSVNVSSGSECADVNIKLGPKAAKLWVKVVDVVTQKPVEDAQVWAAENFAGRGTWSQKIAAAPTPVPALVQFYIHAEAEGYLKSEPLTILPMQPEQTQEITIALQPESMQSAR